ncbi:DUF3732 domain-containing protein [Rhodobacter aestuarii]|uniref:DUF3732 domain-containing protein n=1 Tax=Rhodobacter aestuarii TaxID=453582 RepID=UPI0009711A04
MAQTRSGARSRLNRPFWKARECLVWWCGVAEDRGNDKHIDVSGIGCALPQTQRPYPARLNLPQLTIVFDRPERPVPMGRTGGGENHLAYHLSRTSIIPVPAITMNAAKRTSPWRPRRRNSS